MPLLSISDTSRSYSAREPSHQWTRSAWVWLAVCATQSARALLLVIIGPCVYVIRGREARVRPRSRRGAYYIASFAACVLRLLPGAGMLECAQASDRRWNMGEHTIREILRRRSPETQRAMQRRRELAGGSEDRTHRVLIALLVVVAAVLAGGGYLFYVAHDAGQRFAADKALRAGKPVN